jgi:hypothetical protein
MSPANEGNPHMATEKSTGHTPTEQYLSHLCDRTFLRLWSCAHLHGIRALVILPLSSFAGSS